jgi:hypothetical protein
VIALTSKALVLLIWDNREIKSFPLQAENEIMKRLRALPLSPALQVFLPCGGSVVAFIALMLVAYLP